MASEDNNMDLSKAVLYKDDQPYMTVDIVDIDTDEKDNVNHPSHYEKSCSLECIDVMEAMFGPERLITFCLMNSFKYLWRHRNKNGKEDLDKANWYLTKAAETLDRLKDIWKEDLAPDYDFEEWAENMITRITILWSSYNDKFCKKEGE